MNITIRFPTDVAERVKATALAERRSINSQVITLLEEAMDARKPRPPAPASDGDDGV